MADHTAPTVSNTRGRYGTVAKGFHWATVLMILTLIPLGLIANGMAHEAEAALATGSGGAAAEATLARAATLFSLHKTIGVTLLALALVRIVWALVQPKPDPLHPDRKAETFLAEVVHWLLYAALLLVPLTGWISHAASQGFAPIWWPLGQGLPLVPESTAVKEVAGGLHIVFERVLVAAVILHVAGALKHHVIDRDATLKRMWFGQTSATGPEPHRTALGPIAVAAAVYLGALGVGAGLGLLTPPAETEMAEAEALEEVASDWQVTEGTLGIEVTNFGNPVSGTFSDWTATIAYDPDTGEGTTEVTVAIGSLTLGSVTKNALGGDYLAAEANPRATFAAEIAPEGDGHVADGTLTLKGTEVPVRLPFALTLDGETATASGSVTVDRRDFGVGGEGTSTVGAEVTITIDLTATRAGE